MTKVLIMLSGGLDSSTVAAWAVEVLGKENVGALTVFYGQRHSHEIDAAYKVSRALGIKDHSLLDLSDLFKEATSKTTMLSGSADVPEMTYEEMAQHEGPMPTYIPLRNPVLIAVAAMKAMVKGYDQLWIGVHAEDAQNDAYPDCRADVIGALGAAIHIGSYYKIKVVAPVNHFTKAMIVKLGDDLKVPFELTYSCYNGGAIHCGVCPTCMARKRAFEAAKVDDPTRYLV